MIGCVDAPPETEVWLKPPSGDVSTQFETPCEFQKTDVRAPSATDIGTAQISTLGGIVGVVEDAVAAEFFVAEPPDFGCCWRVVSGAGGAGGIPT